MINVTFTVPIAPIGKARPRKSKYTLEEVFSAYSEHKSLKKTALALGLCPQSVHERLKKYGLSNHIRILTDNEKKMIEALYSEGFEKGDGKLKDLSKTISRTIPFICRYAKTTGLTNLNRKLSYDTAHAMSHRLSQWIKKNGHPRGALGMIHSQESRAKISAGQKIAQSSYSPEKKQQKVMKMLKTKMARGNLINNRVKASWKQGWHEIGGKRVYLRSSWEKVYAEILEKRKSLGVIIEWEYEADTFWFEKIKRGCRSYTPDFKVTFPDGSIEYHEIKGWMDDRSKTKIKRMRIYHPRIKLVVIDAPAYKRLISGGAI